MGLVQKRNTNNGNPTGMITWNAGIDDGKCIEYVRKSWETYGKMSERPCVNDCPVICKM